MKRILIFVYSAFLIIMIANYVYYKSLYRRQIQYIIELLDRQVQIVGLSVDNINNSFLSDLNQISFSEDMSQFFKDPDDQYRIKERMKLFFSKYQDFVTGIKFYNKNRDEFTLKKDIETDDWLEQSFILRVQEEIFDMEKLVKANRNFDYYLPVIDYQNNEIIGNIVVTINYQQYFSEIFEKFNLTDYQWQWVVSDSGEMVFTNNAETIEYSQLDNIAAAISRGSVENIVHRARINEEWREVISSYYSTQLLQRDLGLVFTAPTDFFQKYIIRNSLFIVIATLLLIQGIIFLFWWYLRTQKSKVERLKSSEKMLFKLIEQMPVGVIIYNKNREIIKANKVAASHYSYESEEQMRGKIFPEVTFSDDNDYFSKNLGGSFNPDQFIIIKKEIGEIVLYRDSIPVVFMGEDAIMEILIDITMLESARKQEAKANVAKSEFLARMSYEIRTPLNGIIGMTDVLSKYELTPQVKEIVNLLHRSTELLLGIINDILDFSKIESGKMILDEIPFNLRDEIGYSIDLAKTNISDKALKLNYFIDKDVPENIIGDPFRLRQVLTNLLNHAIMNTDKGEVNMKCWLNSSKEGGMIINFEISDTGRSFDKASLKKVFGEFVNIESKVIRNNDESGFGTILAKQLIELMGGKLTAVSPSGLTGDLGTKVTFTIPTYSDERPKKDVSLEKITSIEDIKALVITGSKYRDEESLGILHKTGVKISVTTYLKSTTNQIKANMKHPDQKHDLLVIFDSEDFNGFEAAGAIMENDLSKYFIMFMISDNDRKGNYRNSISLGVDHYMTKPFDISELLTAIKNNFPYIEDKSLSYDLHGLRKDISILIVEDNLMNQKVIATMLDDLGYKYDLANDGYSGFLKAKEGKYDLIFMDLYMPEMDGFESARKILEIDKSGKIVAFTADNMPDSRRKAELSGIKDFLSKPVRREDLKRLLARYFAE